MNDKLSNGLIIATDSMPDIKTVSVSVLVKSGSRYEAKEHNGVSHFLEHMAFKGTQKRSAREIAEEFDMIGGHFNAYTAREKTVYYAKVLENDVEIAVDILSDIIQNSAFDEAELEKEREVILQELAQTEDTPDDIIFDNFQAAAFPGQAIGRSILGNVETINNTSRESLIDYISTRYSHHNTIISAAGNIKHEEFVKLTSEKFNNLGDTFLENNERAIYKGGEHRTNKDLEQSHIVLGFEGLSYMDKDFYTQQVLSIVLGGGMSSRLFQEIREKRGLVYNISAFSSSYSDSGIFGIYAATSPKNIKELIDVTAAEVSKMTHDVHENELKRAKAQVKAGLLMSQESSESRASKLASNYAIFGRYITISEIAEKIENINVEAIQTLLTSLLKNNKLTLAAIGKLDNLYEYGEVQNKFRL